LLATPRLLLPPVAAWPHREPLLCADVLLLLRPRYRPALGTVSVCPLPALAERCS
jgi:hypothetical protein